MRRPLLQLLVLAALASTTARPTPACIVFTTPTWDVIDQAAWFGVLDSRCEAVPLSEEEIATRRANLQEIAAELAEVLGEPAEDPEEPPESVSRVVEWKVVRTFSGDPAFLPEPQSAAWPCDEPGRRRIEVVAVSADGSAIATALSLSREPEADIDALAAWLRRAVELRRRHGERLTDRHRVEWLVEGAVEPSTRRMAVGEIYEPLGALETDRILRAFVRDPDVPGTLPGILRVLRDEPSLVVDLAAVDVVNAEFGRADPDDERGSSWRLLPSLAATLERLGIPEALRRVVQAMSPEHGNPLERMRDLWRDARCEKGYAPRFECEPDPELAEAGAPQP